MFEKYESIGHKYDAKGKQYIYTYKITDSDFVCETTVTIATPLRATKEARRKCARYGIYAAFIKEYQSRGLDIIRNLFLLNNFVIKTLYYWDANNMGTRLKSHFKDINKHIDYYFSEAEFSKKYFNDLVKYTNKIMTLA